MRLYLSSFRLGDHGPRLRDLAGEATRVAVVANALDASPDDVRRQGVRRELDDLRALGLVPEEVDLRYPGSTQRLRNVDIVWVRGGNVFTLRQALADSGADQLLPDLIASDQLVYAGYSAGPCVLAPSLRGLETVDDVSAVPEPVWDGLHVLDRAFVPHVDSPGHPETAGCSAVRDQLVRAGIPHWALRDGEVLLVDGERTELLPAVTASDPAERESGNAP